MRDLSADLEICQKAACGPWRIQADYGILKDEIGTGDRAIATVWTRKQSSTKDGKPSIIPDETGEANAEFIAAAREGWPEAIERALKAEAEVERLRLMVQSITGGLDEAIEAVHCLEAENTLLRKVAEAAKELVTQINNRTKTMGLDMSNYHAISITVKPGDAGRDYWEAVWAFEQALAELDKEPSND